MRDTGVCQRHALDGGDPRANAEKSSYVFLCLSAWMAGLLCENSATTVGEFCMEPKFICLVLIDRSRSLHVSLESSLVCYIAFLFRSPLGRRLDS